MKFIILKQLLFNANLNELISNLKVQLFKFINGFSKVDLNKYLSFSRGNTRSRNESKIFKPFARTNIYKYSFWLRYIDLWNSLPNEVVGVKSAKKFKLSLREHLYK